MDEFNANIIDVTPDDNEEKEEVADVGMLPEIDRPKSNLTCVQVAMTTRDKLKTFRIAKRETYDEIINRLMNDKAEPKF